MKLASLARAQERNSTILLLLPRLTCLEYPSSFDPMLRLAIPLPSAGNSCEEGKSSDHHDGMHLHSEEAGEKRRWGRARASRTTTINRKQNNMYPPTLHRFPIPTFVSCDGWRGIAQARNRPLRYFNKPLSFGEHTVSRSKCQLQHLTIPPRLTNLKEPEPTK